MKVTNAKELDFYSIYVNSRGEKEIHVYGYSYYGDNWIMADACFFILKLADFIEGVNDSEDYVNNMYSEVKQYEEDFSEEETVEHINSYFDGSPADYYLPFSEIIMETPCGNYVNQWA